MIRTLIVDDDELSRLNLRLICEQFTDVEIVEELTSALAAHDFLREQSVDLILLDIEMPKFSGLDLVRSRHPMPAVIFITGKENYALDAFDHLEHVVDYILKPVSLNRLRRALERFRSTFQPPVITTMARDENRFVFVKTDKRLVRIDRDELLFIETKGDYSIFTTATQRHVVKLSLTQIDEQLSWEQFIKVHRSFIININKIIDIEQNSLVINNTVIPISRSHRAELMSRLQIL